MRVSRKATLYSLSESSYCIIHWQAEHFSGPKVEQGTDTLGSISSPSTPKSIWCSLVIFIITSTGRLADMMLQSPPGLLGFKAISRCLLKERPFPWAGYHCEISFCHGSFKHPVHPCSLAKLS